MKSIIFNIDPIGKPRMVRSDVWSNRKCVSEYWRYKDELNIQAKKLNYKIGEILCILFFIKMPDSWSKKKKERMNLLPHKSKPDTDNLVKGFIDSLTNNDSNIYEIHAKKIWSYSGKIKVFDIFDLMRQFKLIRKK